MCGSPSALFYVETRKKNSQNVAEVVKVYRFKRCSPNRFIVHQAKLGSETRRILGSECTGFPVCDISSFYCERVGGGGNLGSINNELINKTVTTRCGIEDLNYYSARLLKGYVALVMVGSLSSSCSFVCEPSTTHGPKSRVIGAETGAAETLWALAAKKMNAAVNG